MYSEGQKVGGSFIVKDREASGLDKGLEEGKQASQKEVASLLDQSRRLQLQLACESVPSDKLKFQLDQLAAENRSLLEQLKLATPSEEYGAGTS
jgi:hypothetical protein